MMLYDNSRLISNVLHLHSLVLADDYKILGLAQIGMGVISVCDFCLATNTSEYDVYFEKKMWRLRYSEVFEEEEDLFVNMGIGRVQGLSVSNRPSDFKESIIYAKRNLVRLETCVIYDFPISQKFFTLP